MYIGPSQSFVWSFHWLWLCLISGFMESTAYLELVEQQNKYIELCGAAPVHVHSKNSGKPVYYTEIVINTRNK